MKILHLISSLEIGGAQNLIGNLLPILKSFNGIEISVVVLTKTGSTIESELIKSGISVINLGTGKYSIKAILRLIPHLRNHDVIHVHLFPTNYIASIANLFAHKPMIFTEHSTHNRRREHKILRPIEKLVYKSFSKISCISKSTANALYEWIGPAISKPRITVIENGVNLSLFSKSNATDSNQIFGMKGIPLLMISRFVDSKDHPTVLRALKNIENKDIFVVFVGDGVRKKEIEQLAAKYELSDRVIFLGTRLDIPDIIKASKIGIQSSNWEGFGLTAVEMMAGGIPVIASDVDGLKQVVEGAGIIFPKGNHQYLAKYICNLIEDNQLYQNICIAGKERAEQYSINNTARRYIDIYKQISSIRHS